MNDIELTDFIEKELQDRYPEWKPTDVQLNDCKYFLRPFDIDTAKRAIRESLLDKYNTKSPNMKSIISFCRAYAPAKRDVDKKKFPDCTIYIQCVGKDEEGRGVVGFFVPIEHHILPFGKYYEKHIVLEAAQQSAERHKHQLGGVWQIISETTESEMIKARSELMRGEVERLARIKTEQMEKELKDKDEKRQEAIKKVIKPIKELPQDELSQEFYDSIPF